MRAIVKIEIEVNTAQLLESMNERYKSIPIASSAPVYKEGDEESALTTYLTDLFKMASDDDGFGALIRNPEVEIEGR